MVVQPMHLYLVLGRGNNYKR